MIFIFFVQKCIETLEAEDVGIQFQGGAENHLEVPQGYQGDTEVQRGTAKCMQLLERDADVRQPFSQGWKWSRIFP